MKLLQKLYRYGIRGVPLLWFKTSLENRTWYVEVEMLNQTHLLSNVLYLRVLLSVNFIFDV